MLFSRPTNEPRPGPVKLPGPSPPCYGHPVPSPPIRLARRALALVLLAAAAAACLGIAGWVVGRRALLGGAWTGDAVPTGEAASRFGVLIPADAAAYRSRTSTFGRSFDEALFELPVASVERFLRDNRLARSEGHPALAYELSPVLEVLGARADATLTALDWHNLALADQLLPRRHHRYALIERSGRAWVYLLSFSE